MNVLPSATKPMNPRVDIGILQIGRVGSRFPSRFERGGKRAFRCGPRRVARRLTRRRSRDPRRPAAATGHPAPAATQPCATRRARTGQAEYAYTSRRQRTGRGSLRCARRGLDCPDPGSRAEPRTSPRAYAAPAARSPPRRRSATAGGTRATQRRHSQREPQRGPWRSSDTVLDPLSDLLAGRFDPVRHAVRARVRVRGVRPDNQRPESADGDLDALVPHPLAQDVRAAAVRLLRHEAPSRSGSGSHDAQPTLSPVARLATLMSQYSAPGYPTSGSPFSTT